MLQLGNSEGRKSITFKRNTPSREITRTESLRRGSHSPLWEAGTLSQGAKPWNKYTMHVVSRATHRQAGNQTNDYSSYLLKHTKGAIHSQFEEA